MPPFCLTHWFGRRQRWYAAHEWIRMSCNCSYSSTIVGVVSIARSPTKAWSGQGLLHLLTLLDNGTVAVVGVIHQTLTVATHIAYPTVIIFYVFLHPFLFISLLGEFLLWSIKASFGLCEWKWVIGLIWLGWIALHTFFSGCFSSFSNWTRAQHIKVLVCILRRSLVLAWWVLGLHYALLGWVRCAGAGVVVSVRSAFGSLSRQRHIIVLIKILGLTVL